MKKYILLFALFSIRLVFSQELPLDLPVLSPQTPTAFEITKYGEVNVNESTGAISPFIPVFNFKAGPINIPITLQYSGNGVKVNQEPTWAGMNWNVNPGGVITRQVRDLPDEKTLSTNKRYFSKDYLDQLDGADTLLYGTTWSNEILHIATSAVIDSEVDIFNYNFLGYSGSFFLDDTLTNQAHLFNYNKEVKIKFDFITDDQSSITITTPNGDRYFFGYEDSDSSKSFTNSGPGSNALAESAQNAFYLYEIMPITGGSIYFHYTDMVTDTYHYTHGKQESYYVKSYVIDNGCSSGSTSIPQAGTKSFRWLMTSYTSAVYLTEISSTYNSQVVEFNSSKIGDAAISSHHRRKLNNIVLKDGNNTIINKCLLNYEVVDKEDDDFENRFFLTNVQLLGKSGFNNPQEYLMTYNSLGNLPEKASYDQDHFGYFNNAHNLTLLPRVDGYTLIQDDPGLADREADSVYALTGVLNKIEYPTGGTSEFEYELRKTGEELQQIHDQMHVYYQDSLYNETKYLDYPYNDAVFVTASPTDVVFNIRGYTKGSLVQSDLIEVIAKNTVTQAETIEFISLLNPSNTVKPYDENITLSLGSGSYIFSLNINLNNPGSENVEFFANFTIPGTTIIPIYGSGIRIKRVKSMEHETADPLITRYYYNQKGQIHQESPANLVRQPQYIYENLNRNPCGNGGYTETGLVNLTTSSLHNIFSSDAGKILYPYVTISYGGDNFENGGKELKFKVQGDNSMLNYIDPTRPIFAGYGTNLSYANSRLIKETIFKTNGSSFDLVQVTYNSYETDYSKSIPMFNIKPSQYNSNVGYISTSSIERFDIGLYETNSQWDYLDYTEVKDYRASQISPIITKTDYSYTSGLAGLPSEIEIDNSENTKNSKKIYYTSDVGLLSSELSQPQKDLINAMASNHQLDEVIRIESYKNSDSLSTIQKEYGEWYANTLTKNILFSKNGSDFENRLTYFEYDSFGKPIEFSKEKGSHIVYIWGYNNSLPIAKIENVTLMDVHNALSYPPFTILANIQSASNSDIDSSTEETLRADLDQLRQALPESMVSTYTYDPLIGVTSMTDPTGYTSYYQYDTHNRLRYVINKDSIVIKSFDYNYKQIVPQYTVTSTSNGNGTVILSDSEVNEGGNVLVTVTPDSGYQISTITVNGTLHSTSSPFTLSNITSNTVVDVQFSVIPPSSSVSPTSISFNWIDGPETVTVTASGSWTVSKSASWISISATSGSGNGTFTVRPLKNLGSERSGTVTVTISGVTETISIYQADSNGS